jgi:hypothetical protein
MRVTLKAVNGELAKLGYAARLAKAASYFYFQFGEAADWLDRTVAGERVSDRSLDEWVAEFRRLQKKNADILKPAGKRLKAGG